VTSVLFGLHRRVSGGILAPALAHLTWSLLMLTCLPRRSGRPRKNDLDGGNLAAEPPAGCRLRRPGKPSRTVHHQRNTLWLRKCAAAAIGLEQSTSARPKAEPRGQLVSSWTCGDILRGRDCPCPSGCFSRPPLCSARSRTPSRRLRARRAARRPGRPGGPAMNSAS